MTTRCPREEDYTMVSAEKSCIQTESSRIERDGAEIEDKTDKTSAANKSQQRYKYTDLYALTRASRGRGGWLRPSILR